MKNIGLILIFLIVVGVLGAVSFHYKHETTKISKTLESERYSRLVAEEKVVNSVSKIRQLESDLKNNGDKMAKIQAVLKEQKNVNEDLEHQFGRLSKAKKELEEQLKTVLSQPVPVQTNEVLPATQ